MDKSLEHLRDRLIRVALVGCGKAKAEFAQPARDLYIGSLFVAARGYAETCDDWVILSAKHGVRYPNEVTEPYELSMRNLSVNGRDAWAWRAACDLRERYRDLTVQYIALAGVDYIEPLIPCMRRAGLSLPKLPLLGLGIGQRLKWFKEQRRG